MNRKGFTLVELLMVVIIIGILVTLAVPNYYRSVERAKAGTAKAALDAIRKSELQYRAFNDAFTTDIAALTDFDLPAELSGGSDLDWAYTIPTAGDSDLVVVATRSQGPNSTLDFSIDQDGTLDNSNAAPEWGIR